ncbi:alpha/beta hydrolase [Thermobifida halotolerans]|uniref:Alpha/beta hydrolase n=1 Tax=Thermobifida halotolerans TaxID=483545 RepID=A0A399G840_9ACTN|nr:alpha/beta hydrolase [Thermobifida halotolerans]UOE21121.1 alpha/beta hydrolase [Thermobifida halotolerans]
MTETNEKQGPRTGEAPPADLTVRYGPHPDQVADVRFPRSAAAGEPAPLVLLWHGGFWRARHDRGYLEPVVADLVGRGFAVANVEYRRVGGGGGWPATLVDAAAAAEGVPRLVEREAPGLVDRDRTVYVGHSAGGHLAVWVTLRDRLAEGGPGRGTAPRVLGVVALAPVLDLAGAHRLGLGERAVQELMGGGPDDVADRYEHADPSLLGAPGTPVVLVHGDRDVRVPVEESRRYAAAHAARLVEVPGADHFAVVTPGSSAWPPVVDALRTLTGAIPPR